MITEDSFVDYKCPYCGDIVSFPKGHAGPVEECPMCAESVILPREGVDTPRALPLPVETKRLIVRRLQPGDWKDLLEIMADEEVFQYLENRPLTEEEVTRWLEADGAIKLTTPEQPFYLGLESRENQKLIGYLSLRFSDHHRRQTQITAVLNRTFQHQGFGGEAILALLSFCFDGLGLHRVTAFADGRNIAAIHLCESAGMRREAEFREDRYFNGQWVNTVWFGVLGTEHAARRVANPIP